MKKSLMIVITILIVLFFVVVLINSWIFGKHRLSKNNNEEIIFEIKKGENFSEVIKRLKDNKYINTELSFKFLSKLPKFKNKNIYFGKFVFKSVMSPEEIYNVVTSPGIVGNKEINVVIKEGLAIKQIANVISENTNIKKEDFINKCKDKEYITKLMKKYDFLTSDVFSQGIKIPLEGYLFPDTYTFYSDEKNPEVVIEKMLDNMQHTLESISYKNRVIPRMHDVLTLASLVEREGADYSGRKKILNIFVNRINSNMSLGSDVTTYYEVDKEIGKDELTLSDLNKSGYYNTRAQNMNGKLPIGPICSPSKESIEVCLNPEKTDDLYFVSDKNMNIYTAKTYQEHMEIIEDLREKGLWDTSND